ncbi:MAG: histidinol-phosphatase HisJ [Desulfobulbaceae bacterium]|nr:MAG: histidinol-phosphatase HisJ [Desulfobulbaceae bacterium]
MSKAQYVSVHGGHSGQFCNHASDSLEEIVLAYVQKGFSWVGITEHAPGISHELMYADQQAEGLTPELLYDQFGDYITECLRLKKKYRDQLTLYVAIEIETYSGYQSFVPHLVESFRPEYLVGSVHFVNDLNFDYSPEMYERTAASVGGIEQLYEHYFDAQFEMIESINPAVIGHFDLVRIFDHDYKGRLEKPAIRRKIIRNLELIKKRGTILDFNLRALYKGATEPYISQSILEMAKEMEIAVVPGDDSHSVKSVGNYIEQGIDILEKMQFDLSWQKPQLIAPDQPRP